MDSAPASGSLSETDLQSRLSFTCCDVRIDAHTPASATAELMRSRDIGHGRAVHLCNAYTLSLAARDPDFRNQLNAAALNLADGTPVVWVGRRLGFDLDQRVYGPELMVNTIDRGRDVGLRHYLFGGTDESLRRIHATLSTRFPGAAIVGRDAPPFRPLLPWERQEVARRISAAHADVVWVGLGTPRQDHVVHDLAELVPATFVAVGAAFDFLAGTKSQAPVWLRDRGLEWAYRLIREPKRLWRRYLIGNTVFVMNVARGRYGTGEPESPGTVGTPA
jgi:N-acetylglucosaminyldiphosphoundecaprenol N-acetyl-beta-D-mannosaminyltransferase